MTDKLAEVREKMILTTEERDEAVNNGQRTYDWRTAYSSDKRSLEECQADAVAKAQQDKDFNTPITIEKICPECKGTGVLATMIYPCPTCKGTGKLPDKTKTIKQLIEEATKDA